MPKNSVGGRDQVSRQEWGIWSHKNHDLTAKDLVYKYMHQTFTLKQKPTLARYYEWVRGQFPEGVPPIITERTFIRYKNTWGRVRSHTRTEHEWFHGLAKNAWPEWSRTHKGATAKSLLRKYMKDCFSAGEVPTLDGFHANLQANFPKNPPPPITEKTFQWHKSDWGHNPHRTPAEREWFHHELNGYWAGQGIEQDGANIKDAVYKYLDDCHVIGKSPTMDGFALWFKNQFQNQSPPRLKKHYFDNVRALWANNPQRTRVEQDWYAQAVQGGWADWARGHGNIPVRDLVEQYAKDCMANQKAALAQDFGEWVAARYPDDPPPAVPEETAYAYVKQWGNNRDRTKEETRWYHEVHQEAYHEQRANRAGILFERGLFAILYTALQDRGIPLYHETPNFGERGRVRGKVNSQPRRVEGRLFTLDLLAPASQIGPALRDFLEGSGRPENVFDITLGRKAGLKYGKYADEATNVIVVPLGGTGGQRTLEPHTRAVGAIDFAGPNWLNLPPPARDCVRQLIQQTRDALRHGLDSPAFNTLKETANRAWDVVAADVGAKASRAQYEARVGQEIAGRLRRGEMPEQLNAYVQQARNAGDTDHADRLDLMTRAMAALGVH